MSGSIDFIQKTTRENVPFFLYIAFNRVHVPISQISSSAIQLYVEGLGMR